MTFRLSLIALGLAGWLTASAIAADDVEVLARGPVHEAYAEPSEREPKPTPVIPKDPPKPIEELPPDQKPEGDNVQWMPGYWQWDEDRKDFLWVSGFWRNAPPGRAWVPGSWHKAADGWQWTGGFWAGAQEQKAQVEYLPQPPAPLDVAGPATPAPTETHVYVPGSWVYRERYVWQPGYWTEYRPGWVWTAAHYRWTPAGCVFVDGYWDYPLADRGVLFAPAYIPPAVYADPGFTYTPTYVVQESCLFGSLFCRRGFGSYYFGDYFSPTYASLGFTAWCGNVGLSIGIGGGGWYDPLFSYYRCGFRSDPFWGGGGIHNLYAGRYRGDYLRPPHTLVQQNTVINNITRNHTVNNVNVNNVTMVNSINNVARSGRRRFESVGDPARRQFAQAGHATREVAARRATTEGQLAARRGTGPHATPLRAALPVARNPVGRTTPGTVGSAPGGPRSSPGAGGAGNRPARSAPRPAAIGRPRAAASAPAPKATPSPTGSPAGPTDRRPAAGGSRLPSGAPARQAPAPKTTPALPRTAPASPRVKPSASPAAPALPRTKPSASRTVPSAPRSSPSVPRTSPSVPRTAPRPQGAVPRTSPPVTPRVTPRPSAPAARTTAPRPPATAPRAPAARPPVSMPRPAVRPPVSAPRAPAVRPPVTRPAAPRSFARPSAPRPSAARPAAPHAGPRGAHDGRPKK